MSHISCHEKLKMTECGWILWDHKNSCFHNVNFFHSTCISCLFQSITDYKSLMCFSWHVTLCCDRKVTRNTKRVVSWKIRWTLNIFYCITSNSLSGQFKWKFISQKSMKTEWLASQCFWLCDTNVLCHTYFVTRNIFFVIWL